jgi:hypothetical protein
MRTFFFVTAALLLAACKPIALAPEAERVLATKQPAPASCKFLGTVVGSQGGAFSGPWTSNVNLSAGAMNDLKNNAVKLGANYVVIENAVAGNTYSSGPVMRGGGSGQQTDVTYTGNAYRCDEATTAYEASPNVVRPASPAN